MRDLGSLSSGGPALLPALAHVLSRPGGAGAAVKSRKVVNERNVMCVTEKYSPRRKERKAILEKRQFVAILDN